MVTGISVFVCQITCHKVFHEFPLFLLQKGRSRNALVIVHIAHLTHMLIL